MIQQLHAQGSPDRIRVRELASKPNPRKDAVLLQLWVWRHLRIELPEDWEMLQFSRKLGAGRCAFADRYQFRAEVSWQATSGPPDLDRLVSDYQAKLRLDATTESASPTRRTVSAPEGRTPAGGARIGDWRGLRGHESGLFTSRFSRYLRGEGCLIEVVLLWPEGIDKKLEAGILGSIRPEPECAGGMRRWRAFGLDLLAASGLALHECEVAPAMARLSFRSERGERQETFARLGMVSDWLRGSVRDWLARQTPGDVRATEPSAVEVGRHAVEVLRGTRKPGLARKASPYEAAAWLCPADGRLYYVSLTGAEAGGGTGLAGKRLSCCEGMALGG